MKGRIDFRRGAQDIAFRAVALCLVLRGNQAQASTGRTHQNDLGMIFGKIATIENRRNETVKIERFSCCFQVNKQHGRLNITLAPDPIEPTKELFRGRKGRNENIRRTNLFQSPADDVSELKTWAQKGLQRMFLQWQKKSTHPLVRAVLLHPWLVLSILIQ